MTKTHRPIGSRQSRRERERERESKLRHTNIKRANLMASRRLSSGLGPCGEAEDTVIAREAAAAAHYYTTTNFVSFLRIQTGVSSSYSGGDGGHNEMGTVVWTEEEGLGLPHKQESYRRRHRVTTTPTLREISSALLQNFAYNRGLRRLRPSDLFMLASGRILYMISRPGVVSSTRNPKANVASSCKRAERMRIRATATTSLPQSFFTGAHENLITRRRRRPLFTLGRQSSINRERGYSDVDTTYPYSITFWRKSKCCRRNGDKITLV